MSSSKAIDSAAARPRVGIPWRTTQEEDQGIRKKLDAYRLAENHAHDIEPYAIPIHSRATGIIPRRALQKPLLLLIHSPFRLTLRASGTCWVEITDATGHTLFTATLHSGQQQQIPGAGPIVVRIGYTPAMTISVDGIDLDLSGLGQTTNLSFQSV